MDSWTELDADEWAVLRGAELAARGERVRIVIHWRERKGGPLVERLGVSESVPLDHKGGERRIGGMRLCDLCDRAAVDGSFCAWHRPPGYWTERVSIPRWWLAAVVCFTLGLVSGLGVVLAGSK